jgi:hypothetical protein
LKDEMMVDLKAVKMVVVMVDLKVDLMVVMMVA